jgi:hypothetical protein
MDGHGGAGGNREEWQRGGRRRRDVPYSGGSSFHNRCRITGAGDGEGAVGGAPTAGEGAGDGAGAWREERQGQSSAPDF